MKGKKSFVIILAAFVLLIAAASILYSNMSEKYDADTVTETVQKGTAKQEEQSVKAPDFTVVDKNGKQVKLSDFFGKPIVLNFWASWCGPCKSEMPDFNLAYSDNKEDIVFMMVNLTDGQRETVKAASDYVNSAGYSFPVYFDTLGSGATTYGVYSVPTTYFIDKDGFVVAQGKGALDRQTLDKGIGMIK